MKKSQAIEIFLNIIHFLIRISIYHDNIPLWNLIVSLLKMSNVTKVSYCYLKTTRKSKYGPSKYGPSKYGLARILYAQLVVLVNNLFNEGLKFNEKYQTISIQF